MMAMGCINGGSRPGKPAWRISSGLPAAWRSGLTQTWRPVGPGHWRSCNVSVIWPPPHPLGGVARLVCALVPLIDQYHDRQDDAGRLVRRLLREMDSLWVFLAHHGVEPTNNRAERALRFGVQWRKRSLGTASEKGNRWVERILSLKETCRLRSVSTYHVLVEAVARFFTGQQPQLAWLQ